MKKLIILFSLMITSTVGICQSDEVSVNLILLVDDEIQESVESPIFEATSNEGDVFKSDLDYYPGKLSVDKFFKEFLALNKIEHFKFKFQKVFITKGKTVRKNYNLKFYTSWLNERYVILYVYNLDNPKYKKLYGSGHGEYVYDFNISGNKSLTIQEKQSYY